MIKIGVIGKKFGANYIRTIQENLSDIAVVSHICSKTIEEAEIGDKISTKDWRRVCEDARVVIVAAPASLHSEIVRYALNLKTSPHIICEKPFTLDYNEAVELNNLAKSKGVNLAVAHLDLFNSGFRYIRRAIPKPTYADYTINGSSGHEGYNVSWDYLPHGLAVSMELFESVPKVLDVNGNEDKISVKLGFENDGIAHVSANRKSSIRTRLINVWDEKNNLLLDASRGKLWDNTSEMWNNASEDWNTIDYDLMPPIEKLLREFCAAITSEEHARFNGDLACEVIKLLEIISPNNV